MVCYILSLLAENGLIDSSTPWEEQLRDAQSSPHWDTHLGICRALCGPDREVMWVLRENLFDEGLLSLSFKM